MNNQIDELKAIHYELKALVDSQNWKKLNKRLKQIRYNHDLNKSKTALIVTQNLVDHLEIKEERHLMYQSFCKDAGLCHVELPVFKNEDPNVPK